MEGSMNVVAPRDVPGGGTVYGAPLGNRPVGNRGRDANRGVEGVGNVDEHAGEPDKRGDESGWPAVPPPPVPPAPPGSRAFAEAQTDQWILPTDPEAARPWHEQGRDRRPDAPPNQDIPRSPAYAGGEPPNDPGRPGPTALDEDDWDGEPVATPTGEYAGRRRGASRMRAMLGVAAAIVVLAAAVGLPFLIHSSSPAKPSGAAAGINPPDNNGDVLPPVPDPPSNGQLGDPASGTPAPPSPSVDPVTGATVTPGAVLPAGTTPTPSTTTTTTSAPVKPPAPPPTTTTSPAAPGPPPPPPPPFNATVQAESGTRSGAGLFTARCSTQDVVVGALGSVTMSVTVPAAGTYKVQVFYVDPTFFMSEAASISANGGASQNFNVSGPVNCPTSAGTFNLSLKSGANSITISAKSVGIYIDRIVVSHP
jgi:hypothetical protein